MGNALLLLDWQIDFLDPGGRMPVDQSHVGPAIDAVKRAITRARELSWHVVRVGNAFRRDQVLRNAIQNHAALEGSPGAMWDQTVEAAESAFLRKWRPDAFTNPAVGKFLRERAVTALTIARLMASACVAGTATGARKRGLEVRLLRPAILCKSDKSRARALAHLEARECGLVDAIDAQ